MSVIAFYDKNKWNAANLLQTHSHWEGHFGVTLKSFNGNNSVEIDTVEHAKLLIAALETACTDGTLLTEAQLDEFHTHASDSRDIILRRMKLCQTTDVPA